MPAFEPLTKETLPTYHSRIEAIQPDATPLWGTMNTASMFQHLRFYSESSLGIRTMTDKSNALTRFLLKRWFRSTLGMGKGMPTLDIMRPSDPAEAEVERAKLLDLLEKFVETVAEQPDRMEINEMMGPLPMTEWSIYAGKHMDHHLRQFGV
ncbi:DUF1569 domain-containing protein [bacterium]|nr:DUF1569 domain-containing protein [bacterium]